MGRYNRRITADTPMTLTGPAAGTDFVKTAADPAGRTVAGTFANCAGGVTPWGTVLSGEENFHEYFGAAEGAPKPNPVDADRYDRYGVALEPSELLVGDLRPPLRRSPRPPTSPTGSATSSSSTRGIRTRRRSSTPRMGRFKHEGANIYVTDDGTVVAYSGDDERFDYMYKFVSSKKMQPGQRSGGHGAQHDAARRGHAVRRQAVQRHPRQPRSTARASCRRRVRSRAPERGFRCCAPAPTVRPSRSVDGVTAQEAAVFTRFAADKAGATKMDRPEDFEANPKTGKVYVALTNNDERGAPGEAAAGCRQPAQRQQERAGPRDHRQPRRHRLHLGAAAGVRRPGRRRHLLRRVRQDEGQPDLVPGQPGVRQPRQPVDLDRRQRAGLQRRAVRRRARRPQPRRDQAVPHRAARRGDLRARHHRRSGDRVRAASGRARRQQHRQPAVAMAGGRQRHGAAVGRRGVEDRRPDRR